MLPGTQEVLNKCQLLFVFVFKVGTIHHSGSDAGDLGREDLEKEMATHSSTLAWKIPWTEEPGRLQSMESQESDMTERLSLHFTGKLYIGKDSYTQMKKVSTRKNAEIST